MINTKGWTQVDVQEAMNFIHGRNHVSIEDLSTDDNTISSVITFDDGSKLLYIESLVTPVRTCQHFIKED